MNTIMIVSAKMNNVFFSSQNLARIGQVKKKNSSHARLSPN